MISNKTESIILGGGCFWCLDASFRMIRGVTGVTAGYSGGITNNPTYDEVCNGDTGHAEVIKVEFDPSTISLKDILDIFWAVHDPTTINRQGNDVGPQYRSIIIYANDDQEKIIRSSIDEVSKIWPDPITTELQKNSIFFPAEEVHQNYFNKNPEKAYCQIVINPKLTKLRGKYSNYFAIHE